MKKIRRISRPRHFLRMAISRLMIGIVMTGCATVASAATWKEEVLLHDGNRLIVERSQSRGGRHEIGQDLPLANHSISFSLPGSPVPITWSTEFGSEDGKSDLGLLALDVVQGVPFIVTSPVGCIAYNKWGRPNPPYVLFKFVDQAWQRVPLDDFPPQIKEANVVLSILNYEQRLVRHFGVVPAGDVKKINWEVPSLATKPFRVFVRELMKVPYSARCHELVNYKGTWIMPNDRAARDLLDRKQKDHYMGSPISRP